MAAVADATASVCNLSALDSLTGDDVDEILSSWSSFYSTTEALLKGNGDLSLGSDLISRVRTLCRFGLSSLIQDHFFIALQETFEKKVVAKFWQQFDAYTNVVVLQNSSDPVEKSATQLVLCKALDEISLEKQYQEKCLSLLVNGLQDYADSKSKNKQNTDVEKKYLLSKYQLMVSSVLMATLPRHFPGIVEDIVQLCNDF